MEKRIRILASVLLLVFVFAFLPIRGEEKIYESVIRLHVVANSNSETDQKMKLFVRDRVLSECREYLFGEGGNAKEVYASLREKGTEKIEESARSAVADFCDSEGIISPGVNVRIGEEHYPMKHYEALCFPSGEYFSLRIEIGDAAGENWWCVLFPPLCFAASSGSAEKDDFISVGLTPDQYNVISNEEKPKYRIRFKILEWIEEVFAG